MSSHGAAASSRNNSPAYSQSAASASVQPQRMDLSLNPEDGSLQIASLFHVLLAATDALYTDLYNMAQGELDVITSSTASSALSPKESDQQSEMATASTNTDVGEGSNEQQQQQVAVAAAAAAAPKKERMSNLSFAQRRHELQRRLIANGKRLQQVSVLTAAASSTDLAQDVQISIRALQHTRTAWVQADEAQDALYYFHQQLFLSRAAPHDIYGACDVLLNRMWYDLPRDLLLQNDYRYESSPQRQFSKSETDQRWQLAVRDKLMTGEVGWMRTEHLLFLQKEQQQKSQSQSQSPPPPLWKVSLKGGIVKFTHGQPKIIMSSADTRTERKQYPIEAILTVLPAPNQTPTWTLLSVNVHVQAKTGEFNHQLETSNRQRYDLHRLAALAMSREEVRSKRRLAQAELSVMGSAAVMEGDGDNSGSHKKEEATLALPPSRPLHALFQVTHTFLLAWQLELLSAQSQALRRGVWAAADSNAVTIQPVSFRDINGNGVMSISFWKIDDTYGQPTMGDLELASSSSTTTTAGASEEKTTMTTATRKDADLSTMQTTSQLTLTIRAEADIGIRVSLSGADSIKRMVGDRAEFIRLATRDLLEAVSNPCSLSASDALLAATKICAELKCHAVVDALYSKSDILPPWISLSVDSGSIVVAARIGYHGVVETEQEAMPTLFRIMCDLRTGSFASSFPRSMKLLRYLACNDRQASSPMSLRVASLPPSRRRSAGVDSSGRAVRDTFDSLIRSMNLLGQRAGVGGKWDDVDEKSGMLRARAILTACTDVRTSLVKCCGMTALYGLTPIAMAAAQGLDAIPDLAGFIIDSVEGINLFPAPPLSVLLDQQVVENSVMSTDGVTRKISYIDQSFFSVVCSAKEDGLSLLPLEISAKLDSPAAFPVRTATKLLEFKSSDSASVHHGESNGPPSCKKQKLDMNGGTNGFKVTDLMTEVEKLSKFLTTVLCVEADDNQQFQIS